MVMIHLNRCLTSHFVLSERFGDGDTSQIGLDLDEVNMIYTMLKINMETNDLFLL